MNFRRARTVDTIRLEVFDYLPRMSFALGDFLERVDEAEQPFAGLLDSQSFPDHSATQLAANFFEIDLVIKQSSLLHFFDRTSHLALRRSCDLVVPATLIEPGCGVGYEVFALAVLEVVPVAVWFRMAFGHLCLRAVFDGLIFFQALTAASFAVFARVGIVPMRESFRHISELASGGFGGLF